LTAVVEGQAVIPVTAVPVARLPLREEAAQVVETGAVAQVGVGLEFTAKARRGQLQAAEGQAAVLQSTEAEADRIKQAACLVEAAVLDTAADQAQAAQLE
jgi:xylose isomerase